MVDKYRLNDATGDVYEYDNNQKAYVFCGNLNNKSLAEFIIDKEESELLK